MDIKILYTKIEELSEEVHNAWMKEKLEQGFHSPLNCDETKRQLKIIPRLNLSSDVWVETIKFQKQCPKCHTDLYPYSELPENVKEYDRVTVRAVLKAIETIER